MTDSTRDLLERAKKLSVRERAELARELLQTLDTDEDPATVEDAWRKELEQRHERALGGEPASDWREALARIRRGLGA